MIKKLGLFFFMLIFMVSTKVYGYDSELYNNNQIVKIGLKSMSSSNVNVYINKGSYIFNGKSYNVGNTITLSIVNGLITYNGQAILKPSFIESGSDNIITLNVNGTIRNYKGDMSFVAYIFKDILPINSVNIEDYLKGVVGYEMSDSYPLEALKAQAVAARNYTLANLSRHKSYGYNLCDTTHCQVYKGYQSSYQNVIKAVDETEKEVLLSGTSLASCYYSASNGGYTEASQNVWSASLPYLISKKDTYDGKGKYPSHQSESWSITYTAQQLDQALKIKNTLKDTDEFVSIDLSKITKYTSGRIYNITINYKDENGTSLSKSFSKESARTFLSSSLTKSLSLRSSLYNVTFNNSNKTYTIAGEGYGHGIGLSQLGAYSRAKAGQTYIDILKFYYDGTNIVAPVDVNQDFVVDIFDLVLVSKNIGQSKGNSTIWNDSYNVDDSDNVIDLKDITKVAQEFNRKY